MDISKRFMKSAVAVLCAVVVIFALFIFNKTERTQETSIIVKSEKMLIPGGHSIGVRMDVKGVIVVGLEDIISEDGKTVNPGLNAGLEIGDTIIEVSGEKVYKAKEVQEIVNDIKGTVNLKIQRKERIVNIKLEPVKAKDDGLYKLGVWIKDKTAGIGTLTFYDPETNMFGALGHGITDIDTGIILDVNEGELLDSKVESVKEGKSGEPGEIHGIFYETEAPLGKLVKNTKFGIFGEAYEQIENSLYSKPLAIATQSQIKEGTAYILTTIEGDTIEKFEIEIEKIMPQKKADAKSMIIRVTDKELIKRTGGIVQGMSGSPIIQDGKLIGAVTHVCVNL